MSAKGKTSALFLSLVGIILYSFVSWRQKLYGELIVSYVLMVPLCVYGIVSWLRNQSEATNSIEINHLSKREVLAATIVGLFILVAVYFLLRYFNTANLEISALSVFVSLLAAYLEARRSRACYYFYILNDLVLVALWGITGFRGDLAALVIAVEASVNLFADSYGLFNWKRLAGQQKERS